MPIHDRASVNMFLYCIVQSDDSFERVRGVSVVESCTPSKYLKASHPFFSSFICQEESVAFGSLSSKGNI